MSEVSYGILRDDIARDLFTHNGMLIPLEVESLARWARQAADALVVELIENNSSFMQKRQDAAQKKSAPEPAHLETVYPDVSTEEGARQAFLASSRSVLEKPDVRK